MLNVDALIAKLLNSAKEITATLAERTPAYCYVNSMTAITITAQSTDTLIPITGLGAHTSEFSLQSNGFKISKAGRYMFSAQASCNTATSGDLMGISIYKNGTSWIGPEYNRVGGTYDRIALLPTIIDVSANDVFTLYGRNNSSGRGTFNTLRLSVVRLA